MTRLIDTGNRPKISLFCYYHDVRLLVPINFKQTDTFYIAGRTLLTKETLDDCSGLLELTQEG